MTSPLLANLNPEQLAAVTLPHASALILAGAGSGKTRVLTTRIAWLLATGQASPLSILAVTFTNKAAKEMLVRLSSMTPVNTRGMWIGTFHGLCNRLLRTHYREAGLPQLFQILDTQDQLALIKRLMKSLNIDEERYPPRQAQWFIAGNKDEGRRAAQVEPYDEFSRRMRDFYAAYDEQCQREGVVDFAELLLRAFELLSRNEPLRAHYRARFRHVLVDEFQDTNRLQYQWLKLLGSGAPAGEPQGAIFAVGDDDQSIYAFRGASSANMQDLQRDFALEKVIKLEQNYRSHGNILEAANALIRHNRKRLGKNLWTAEGEGEALRVYEAATDIEEARFILDEVKALNNAGVALNDIAVLYRSNAQSRVLEHALFNAAVPYRVYGGMRFFERAEIKHALAYLRLIATPIDDGAFLRIVNFPPRGIGARTLEVLRAHARANAISLWRSAAACTMELGARASTSLQTFLALIERLDDDTRDLPLHEQVDHVIQASGLAGHYQKDKADKGEARLENLEELVSAARGFEPEDGDMPPLMAFLSHAVLESGEGQAEEWEDCVQMMTLHSAKGLEFPVVFLCGLEDGLFPHQRSIMDLQGLEEERRLCYVGTTRAMRHLYLTYAEQRRMHGVDSYGAPSRFIAEIPAELVEEVRPKVQVSRPAYVPQHRPSGVAARSQRYTDDTPGSLRLGQRVRHQKFGDGVVLSVEGQGSNARVQVNFERQGTKWLMMGYAHLQVV